MSIAALAESVRAPRQPEDALFKKVFVAAAICLFAGLLAGLWVLLAPSADPSSRTGIPAPLRAAAALGFGGLTSVLLTGVGFLLSQKAWKKRITELQEEHRRSLASTQMQVAELRAVTQTFDKLESDKNQLANAKNQLEAELDTLKRSQKDLLWRRQALESSKTVLELHVQERSEEIQRLQRQYELILNSAGEGICGLDLNGKATFVNPAAARMTGWEVQELIGKSEEEIFGSTTPATKDSPAPNTPEERPFRRKNGSLFPVECVKTPLDENGRVVGSVLIFKDITKRKRIEEAVAKRSSELAQSNAELEQFAFVASHDLQEPLRKIQAFGDRLKTKVEGALAPDARDYLDRMQSASARMRTLINDLLAFSRVIRRTEPFVPVDLAHVAKGVLGDLEVRIEKSGARVDLGPLPVVEADTTQMHQLLLNLIGNGLKFQPPGGKPVVTVSSRTYTTLSGQELCEITVADNGIGFEEKYLEKMFAVFQRLHGRNEFEGTGVGLAVCRRITDRHHGTITAKGQLGKGSTFIVTLPVHQEPTPQTESPDTSQIKQHAASLRTAPAPA
jgi:PAS domain S-box-containing protein